jgi:hypothetical protein
MSGANMECGIPSLPTKANANPWSEHRIRHFLDNHEREESTSDAAKNGMTKFVYFESKIFGNCDEKQLSTSEKKIWTFAKFQSTWWHFINPTTPTKNRSSKIKILLQILLQIKMSSPSAQLGALGFQHPSQSLRNAPTFFYRQS